MEGYVFTGSGFQQKPYASKPYSEESPAIYVKRIIGDIVLDKSPASLIPSAAIEGEVIEEEEEIIDAEVIIDDSRAIEPVRRRKDRWRR